MRARKRGRTPDRGAIRCSARRGSTPACEAAWQGGLTGPCWLDASADPRPRLAPRVVAGENRARSTVESGGDRRAERPGPRREGDRVVAERGKPASRVRREAGLEQQVRGARLAAPARLRRNEPTLWVPETRT